MDLGKLMQQRQSQNVEDLRSSYKSEDMPGGGKVFTFENFMPDTTVPWQANTKREPLPGALGALTQSAKSYTDQESQKALLTLRQLLGPGVDVVLADEGGFLVRKTPPMPERNPMRPGPSKSQ